MSAALKYQKYPDAVRIQIAKSKNPYLFPEYNIPRTTALYWIKKSEHQNLKTPSEESLAAQKIKSLETALKKEQALTNLVQNVRKIWPYNFKYKKVPSKNIRRKIIEALQKATRLNKVRDCLELIGLSKSTYTNWLSEFFLCENKTGRCQQRLPHQLTPDEINTMRKLILSKKYAHFSIQSLCLFAQKNALLFCSIDSWYKYKRIFNWNRPRDLKKDKTEKIGIRAKAPNEIWHIDVTQVKTRNRQVIYIQAIYDNYSRFVLAWRVTTEISAAHTVDLISAAKNKAQTLGRQNLPTLVSDGGPENDNRKVLNFVNSKNINRMIARVDIHFSNSMIESLFRMLKSNFLKYEDLRGESDVARKVDFFFSEHNEVIPRCNFQGATPKEVFLNTWSSADIESLKSRLANAAKERKIIYKATSCNTCQRE